MTNSNKDKPVKSALLADDIPEAKRYVLLLIVAEALLTFGICVLMFFANKLDWGAVVFIALFVCWMVSDVIFWQLWKSIAYRLTVTEKEIVVNLFFHKKKMTLADVKSYECEAMENTKFHRFRLTDGKKNIVIATQYREEMIAILATRTTAFDVNAPKPNESQTN